MLNFIRIACAVPEVKVGNVAKNVEDICSFIKKADAQDVDIVLFPELAITGYTCGDLFFQDALWNAVKSGLSQIAVCSADHPRITAVVGLPVRIGHKLYNCAAVLHDGNVCGIVPKVNLNAAEKRWFASGSALVNVSLEPEDLGISCVDWPEIPVDTRQLFCLGENTMVGIEICEDLMVPQPCSANLSVAGAEVILNLSASHDLAGKRSYRRELVTHQSCACNCIYAFASAGYTESTSDLIFSGHSIIAENGRILAESESRPAADYMLVMDCDLGRIRADRLRSQNYGTPEESDFLVVMPDCDDLRADGQLYPVQKLPFIPSSREERIQRCFEIFQLQVTGLKQRLKTISTNAVLGISGGLDSTLALLVAVEAMRQLGRPASDVYGVTMPCFGTSDRTYTNAWELMRKLGIHAKEISIKAAVTQHFADIGHDSSVHNGTYENAQARERTQILMDYASTVNGIVVGTGDLSELALGWCTYNGDHMSMYGVNGTVPKTLIRWIIEAVAETDTFCGAKAVLQDILDTPISPELLPPDAQGKISQQTEDLVGPYALHDFYLYHMLRYGFSPTKIYHLACRAFREDFQPDIIKKWLRTFYWRFFSQQFKRNCMPDGVKVGSVGLGPRGDWTMPSDASGKLWLEEIETL